MVNTIVTGGAGFIGSHLVEALHEKGHQVTVIDNLFTGKMENLAAVKNEIEFVQGDVRDAKLLAREFRAADVVFHEAALRSVLPSVRLPLEYNEVNVTGTLNVLEAARQQNVQKVIIASSSSVYGNTRSFPQRESLPYAPLNPYAVTKAAGELYAEQYWEHYGLETICLRYFNVYGPRQDPHSNYATVIPVFARAVMQGKQPVIYGTGRQSRDFSFVHDVVGGNLAALRAKQKAAGKAYNLAPGKSTSINQILALINAYFGTAVRAVRKPARKGEILKSQCDPMRAAKLLNYYCATSIEQGLPQTMDWYALQQGKKVDA